MNDQQYQVSFDQPSLAEALERLKHLDSLREDVIPKLQAAVNGPCREIAVQAVETGIHHFLCVDFDRWGPYRARAYLDLLLSWLRSGPVAAPSALRLQVESLVLQGLTRGLADSRFRWFIAYTPKPEDLSPFRRVLDFCRLLKSGLLGREDAVYRSAVDFWAQFLQSALGPGCPSAWEIARGIGGEVPETLWGFRAALWSLVDGVCAWLAAEPSNDDRLYLVEPYLSPTMTPQTGAVLEHRFWGSLLARGATLEPKAAQAFLDSPVQFVLSSRTKHYSNRLLAAWLTYWSRSVLGAQGWLLCAFTPMEWAQKQPTWRHLKELARANSGGSLVS